MSTLDARQFDASAGGGRFDALGVFGADQLARYRREVPGGAISHGRLSGGLRTARGYQPHAPRTVDAARRRLLQNNLQLLLCDEVFYSDLAARFSRWVCKPRLACCYRSNHPWQPSEERQNSTLQPGRALPSEMSLNACRRAPLSVFAVSWCPSYPYAIKGPPNRPR
jgi:hypothetical protein